MHAAKWCPNTFSRVARGSAIRAWLQPTSAFASQILCWFATAKKRTRHFVLPSTICTCIAHDSFRVLHNNNSGTYYYCIVDSDSEDYLTWWLSRFPPLLELINGSDHCFYMKALFMFILPIVALFSNIMGAVISWLNGGCCLF